MTSKIVRNKPLTLNAIVRGQKISARSSTDKQSLTVKLQLLAQPRLCSLTDRALVFVIEDLGKIASIAQWIEHGQRAKNKRS